MTQEAPLDAPAVLVVMHRDIDRVWRVLAEVEKVTARNCAATSAMRWSA